MQPQVHTKTSSQQYLMSKIAFNRAPGIKFHLYWQDLPFSGVLLSLNRAGAYYYVSDDDKILISNKMTGKFSLIKVLTCNYCTSP